MKAIETTAVVSDDRKLTVQLPPDVAPGPHHIVVVADGCTYRQAVQAPARVNREYQQ